MNLYYPIYPTLYLLDIALATLLSKVGLFALKIMMLCSYQQTLPLCRLVLMLRIMAKQGFQKGHSTSPAYHHNKSRTLPRDIVAVNRKASIFRLRPLNSWISHILAENLSGLLNRPPFNNSDSETNVMFFAIKRCF